MGRRTKKGVVSPEVESRRNEVMRLYLQNWRQCDIADHLGVSRRVVCTDIKAVRAELHKERIDLMEERQALELAKLDEVERNAWVAWEKSRLDAEQVKTTEEDGAETKTETTVKKQAGDARYLAVIKDCVDKRCKILGLDAPDKLEVNGGGPVVRELIVADRADVKRIEAFKEAYGEG